MSVHSRSNRSISVNRTNVLGEPEIVKLQRDLDHYTRKLEQEKRRLFGLDEAYNSLHKEFKERKTKMDKMASPTKIEKKQNDVQIINLQNQLEQSLSKYNEVLAENQKLRENVDVVRRERVTYDNVRKEMEDELKNIEDQKFEQEINHKSMQQAADRMKEKIIRLKEKNFLDQSTYLSEYDKLQQKYKDDIITKRKDTTNRGLKPLEKMENLDTQNLMKKRLQRIILSNKEKVKVIDQYRKNMAVIDEAFRVIQESSGIQDIEEIMNTFIKSEEQNYSLFNYVNMLTQELDFLEENNKDLEQEMKMLEFKAEQKQKQLEKPPEEEVERQKINDIISKKEGYIQNVRDQLTTIKEPLENILKELSKTKFCAVENLVIVDDFILNEQTIDYYLSIFEDIINRMIPYVSKINDNKDFLTTGLLLEELNVKDFDKIKSSAPNIKEIFTNDELVPDQIPFLEGKRLEELAKDTIERYKERSVNLGTTSLLEKSVRDPPSKLK
jgi:chromosome segregation ATPase